MMYRDCVLQVKLKLLDDCTISRQRNAAAYRQLFVEAGCQMVIMDWLYSMLQALVATSATNL